MDTDNFKGMPIQLVRSLAKQKLLPIIDSKIRRWPFHGNDQSSGVFWNRQDDDADYQVIKNSEGFVEKRVI